MIEIKFSLVESEEHTSKNLAARLSGLSLPNVHSEGHLVAVVVGGGSGGQGLN